MLLIRKLWLATSLVLFLSLYYLYHSSRPTILPIDNKTRLEIRPERNPVETFTRLPTGTARQLPRIQTDFDSETIEQENERLQRLAIIKEAFVHSWRGYKKYAWRQDEITPLSGVYRNPFGGWGASLVDAMGTLWIMGLKDEFEECVEAIKFIDFTTNTEDIVNVFETTIRYLGGFLSAYDLSEHKFPSILDKAVELANILYITFDTPNRLPLTRWPWQHSAAGVPLQAAKHTLLAEIGSMSVEFTRLAQLTGDPRWFDAIDRITELLYTTQNTTKLPGMWPTLVDAENGQMSYNHFTLGGMADSTSEYLPKEYMILGGLDGRYRDMYVKVITTAKKHIFYRPLLPGSPDLLFSGNAGLNAKGDVKTETQAQHLTCFTGGMIGIAAKIFDRPEDLDVAERLTRGCVWAYTSMPSGLMPETSYLASCHIGTDLPPSEACTWSETKWYEAISKQNSDLERTFGETLAQTGQRVAGQENLLPGYTKWGDNRYILRPEAIESVFIMYRITGDRSYLDAAWKMWESITKSCRTSLAFAGLSDVRVNLPAQSDKMESFWLAETLKYFYLIFSHPTEWSLDEWVLNTEAHFLKRPEAGQPLSI